MSLIAGPPAAESPAAAPPEHNVTGVDYADRCHLPYAGPLIDIHAHVTVTGPDDPPGPPLGSTGPGSSTAPAEVMLDAAGEFGVVHTVSMCLPDQIPVLRDRFGDRLSFNGWISKHADEPEDAAYRLLDRFLEQGVRMLKFWSAPRGRPWGMVVDAPWRIEVLRRARAAGLRVVMVHVADPDVLFRTRYADARTFRTKDDQYPPFERLMVEFPDVTWIGAHLGGDPEHPDHLERLLERYPNLYLDTSGTKWLVREASARAGAIRSLVCRYPDRFLFGSDLVTRYPLPRDHYVSRYWCQRTLWESGWEGPSPIADPEHAPGPGCTPTPTLRGLGLPRDVLEKLYFGNASRILHNA